MIKRGADVTDDEHRDDQRVEAVQQIGHTDPGACYNMLFAIEGAIRRVRWHAIPKEERAEVTDRFDQARSSKQLLDE